jgi:hypothetical protein
VNRITKDLRPVVAHRRRLHGLAGDRFIVAYGGVEVQREREIDCYIAKVV